MEWVRSSIAALLFLTLLVLVASGDDAAAAAVEEQCHPLVDDELYQLVTFQHKDGEEIRLLADRSSRLVSGFANRSGHWFYATGRESGNNKRRLIPLPESRGGGIRTAEGFWNTLGVLVNTTAASDPPAPDYYMLVNLQTSGGDKNRLVVVANQRYLSVTGFAQGFSSHPNWFFREGLVVTLGDDVWSSHGGSSHADVVACKQLIGALMDGGAGLA